jgi:hypothetical protein
LLKRRLAGLDLGVEKKLDRLSGARLAALSEALLSFAEPSDLQRWLARKGD